MSCSDAGELIGEIRREGDMNFFTLWALYALKFYNESKIGEKRIVKGQKEGQCMNMYERYSNRELPEEIQRQAESFAGAGKSDEEELFRAGFWIGRNIREIQEKTGGTDDGGEADRGPEDVQVRP